MITTRLLITLLSALPLAAAGGEIYGKVSLGGAPVGADVTVAAQCGSTSYPAVTTDKAGSYNLVVAETGRCLLTITRAGLSTQLAVASYEDAAQADIVLELRDGVLAARRR